MIEQAKKRRKLSLEVLSIVAVCFAFALLLYLLIARVTPRLVEEYCFYYDIVLDEYEYYKLDTVTYGAGTVLSVLFFVVLFFALFGERLAYIRRITEGVDALRNGNYGYQVRLVGNNELTELAETVNFLSQSEQSLKAKEKQLSEEKENLIRTLSHDIRTPLTSIMSYTELLSSKEHPGEAELKEYLIMVGKKSALIKELTDILLDGGKRRLEQFEDARLLFRQLAEEFTEELEEDFDLCVEPSPATAFSGSFDVGEMRRIFENLISNVKKYADPAQTVKLSVDRENGGIVIRQSNRIGKGSTQQESYKMGLNSIRRIAQNYGGGVSVTQTRDFFEITVTLSNI